MKGGRQDFTLELSKCVGYNKVVTDITKAGYHEYFTYEVRACDFKDKFNK